MSHGTVSTREFLIHGEVATRFLLRASWLRPGPVFAGSIVIYLIVPILWSYSNGNLVGHGENDAYVEGFLSARNSYVFALPFMFATVINYYLNTTFVVGRLVSRGVLESTRTGNLHELFAKHKHRWKTNTLTAIPPIVAIALFIWFLLNPSRDSGLPTTWLFYQKDAPRPIAYYYAAIVHGFAVYVLLSWGLLHFRASHKLHGIFKDKKRFRINLVVLHPR